MDASPSAPKKLTASVFSGFVQQRSALAKTSVTPTEQRALEAVSQQRLDTFYDRFGTVLAR